MLRTAIAIVLLATLLSGCKQAIFSRVCPPLQQYDDVFLGELAKEYAEIIDGYPHVAQVVHDYGVTREDIRACIKRTQPNT